MEAEYSIKEDMRKLGCKCDRKIMLGYHLYIYLVDQKLMYDTEYCYNKDVDVLYIVAKPNKTEKLNIYVPIPTNFDISMEFINLLQDNLCTVETGSTINFAFIESDLTTVIYTFSKGLVERPSVEKNSEVRLKEERRTFINKELKKSYRKILSDALDGGVVDDDDCLVLD